MTPGARVQAAIEVLDRVLAGAPAERELTGWARRGRYAGAKDRAAVRDHVFDALRRLRSAAWTGGLGAARPEEMDARAVVAGLLAGRGTDLQPLFDGAVHSPAPIVLPDVGTPPRAVALDIPDWLLPRFEASLGDRTDEVLSVMRDRAPVDLRVNLAQTDQAAVQAALAEMGVSATSLPEAPTALRIEIAPRGLTRCPAFAKGLFDLQDAGSQMLVDRLPLSPGERILDLCAGGGGKTLAMAGRGAAHLFAHDAAPERMRDLPARAARAGAEVALLETPEDHAPFDGIVADVPCSGSGSWRRAPEAKWRLTPDRLVALTAIQSDILKRAVRLVRPGGWVAYMTCSLLDEENAATADAILAARDDLRLERRWSTGPDAGTDGFHLSLLRRD